MPTLPAASPESGQTLRGLRFDPQLSAFFLRNTLLKTNDREKAVLRHLMANPGGARKQDLLDALGNPNDINYLHKAVSELRKVLRDGEAIQLSGDVYRLVPERIPEAVGPRFSEIVQNLHQQELIPLSEFLDLIFAGPFDGQPPELLSGLVIAANPFELLLKDPGRFFQSLAGGRRWTLILSEPHRIPAGIETLFSVGKELWPLERNLRLILCGPVLGLPRVYLNWRDPRFGVAFGVHLSGTVAPGSKAWFTGEGLPGPDWQRELRPQPGPGILSVADGIDLPGWLRSGVMSEFRGLPEIAAQAGDLIAPQ